MESDSTGPRLWNKTTLYIDTMDTKVHFPVFPALHRMGTKHKTETVADNATDDNNLRREQGDANQNAGNSSPTLHQHLPMPKSLPESMLRSRLSEKLKHAGTESSSHGNGHTRANSSGGKTKLPHLLSPKQRATSKSSGFSVTVDLPTIRPSAGVYSPNQKMLSRINTFFSEESSLPDKCMDGSSSDGSSSSSSSSSCLSGELPRGRKSYSVSKESTSEDEDDEEKNDGIQNGEHSLTIAETAEPRGSMDHRISSGDGNFTQMHTPENMGNSGTFEESKFTDDSHLAHNKADEIYGFGIQSGKHVGTPDTLHNIESPNGFNNEAFPVPENTLEHSVQSKKPDFFLSETKNLLNNRIKLLDNLHLNCTSTSGPEYRILQEELESSDDVDNARYPEHARNMIASLSDMSVLKDSDEPYGRKTNDSRMIPQNMKNRNSTVDKNTIYGEIDHEFFAKHPNISIKHYTKIANRAKHVGSYLSIYYAYIEEYQKVHHVDEKTNRPKYPGVDGVWNPLQIMRNRRIRMHKGEKLKNFSMHGQKVGVFDMNSQNDLENLTTTNTAKSNILTSESSGLGISHVDSIGSLFAYDWRKVKVASRVFSRHSKQRLIWQIGLHEIIGDILWRDDKWNELKDPSGKRWFAKHSISYHKKIGSYTTEHVNSLGSKDSKDSKDSKENREGGDSHVTNSGGERKVRKIHELLFVDSTKGEGSSRRTREAKENDILKEKEYRKNRDRERDEERDREGERERESEKDRSASLRRKNDNLASVARFEHYKRKGAKDPNGTTAKVEKSGNNNVRNNSIEEAKYENGDCAFNASGAGSNDASLSKSGEGSFSLISDIEYYDAVDEALDLMKMNRTIEGNIESSRFELFIKEHILGKELKERGKKLKDKISTIETLQDENQQKYLRFMELIEESEIDIEKQRQFIGSRANNIEELLGYCDRGNGEINTSITLRIRNLDERADGLCNNCENGMVSVYFYKFLEAGIVSLLWFVWIVVETWLWCKWGVCTVMGIVRWILI